MQAFLLSVHVVAGILFVGPVAVAASLFPRYAPVQAPSDGALPVERPRVTRAGSAGKALVLGLILTPISVFAPAGLLSFMGVEVTDSPLFPTLAVLFPIILASLIYRRARRDRVTADEGFRRLLPRAIRQEDDNV